MPRLSMLIIDVHGARFFRAGKVAENRQLAAAARKAGAKVKVKATPKRQRKST